MNLQEKLKKRLSHTDLELEQIVNLLNHYDIKINIKNFDDRGLILWDLRGKSVRISFGNYRNDMVHIADPNSDIAIVFADGLLSGWIESNKLQDATDRMLVDIKSLHKMPTKFLFVQQCSHLEVYGGFYDGEAWTCAECDERLIFNDN